MAEVPKSLDIATYLPTYLTQVVSKPRQLRFILNKQYQVRDILSYRAGAGIDKEREEFSTCSRICLKRAVYGGVQLGCHEVSKCAVLGILRGFSLGRVYLHYI